MPDRPFHEILAQHLDHGTRPGLKPGAVGGKWTAIAFGKATQVTDRTVRNWRSGQTLPDPDPFQDVLSALFGTEPALAAERAEMQEAWDHAQRQRLNRTKPLPGAPQWRQEREHFVIIRDAAATDALAAEDPAVQAQHAVARSAAGKLLAAVRRQHNSLTPSWDDLLPTAEALSTRLEGETASLPTGIVFFYHEAVSLGSLLEQHNELMARPDSMDEALAPDLRRALADALGATALLVRAFPTNRERDEQNAMFWAQGGLAEARAMKAQAAGLVAPAEQALLDRIERAAERGGIQGQKAGRSLLRGMTNLALNAAVSFAVSAYVNASPMVAQRVGPFLVGIEEPLGRIRESLPGDLAATLRYAVDLAKKRPDFAPAPVPHRLPPPDFDLVAVHRMILAGEAPPLRWVPFIEALDFNTVPLTDLSPLAGLSSLQELWLNQTGVTDLSPLAGLSSLQELWLNQTGVTDLSPLAGLSSLQELWLDQTGVTDLSPLAGLSSLQRLDLDHTGATDLSPLAGLSRLQTLTLNRTGVTNLAPLTGLSNLQELWLNQTGVTDLSPLAGLSRLQTVRLDHTYVTDLSPLAGLSSLQRLDLDQTGVTDLSPLAGLSSLQTLTLNRTGVTDLSQLAGLSGLQELWLNQTGVTDLSPLAGLSSLETLTLNQTGVTDLSQLAGLSSLRTFRFNRTGVIDLSPLAGLSSLRTLRLDHTDVTDLSPLAGLSSLQELWLNETGVTDLSPLVGLSKLSVFMNGREFRPARGEGPADAP